MSPIPYVGQLVDYYPAPSERHAAIVTNTFLTEATDGVTRPKVNLTVFQPDGSTCQITDVSPVDQNVTGDLSLAECWAYQHEFAILQEADHDPSIEQGIYSNMFVGTLQNLY